MPKKFKKIGLIPVRSFQLATLAAVAACGRKDGTLLARGEPNHAQHSIGGDDQGGSGDRDNEDR